MTGDSSTTPRRPRRMARVLAGARDAWLILGVTLAFILLFEGAYRTQSLVRRAIRDRHVNPDSIGPASPFDTSAWAVEYWKGHEAEEAVHWAAYVERRNPTFKTRYHTVDTLGHRVTPLPPSSAGRPLRIFFLGGSTTFGWYQRDDHTIPAEATRRLQASVGERARILPTNFGVPGHTFTQEILELMLQLRAGARPDVVVFYDGINDVAAAVQNGRAGLPQNEANRETDFIRGRELAALAKEGWRNDVRVIARSVTTMLSRSQIVERIRAAKAPPPPKRVPADSLARDMARIHVANADFVETLAARYGFQVIYVWQPALLSTHKPLTPREKWLLRPQPIRDLHIAAPPLVAPAMTALVGSRFIDATTLFDNDPNEVYVDVYGHTYERANPRIVDTLMPNLTAAVNRVLARPPGTSASGTRP